MSLLTSAEPIASRLKMFVYGGTGVGKTITSLHFPSPAVIDTERGTEHYGKFFEFKRIFTDDTAKVIAVIDELLKDPVVDGVMIKTIVVDSFSVLYDSLMLNFISKQKIKTGNSSYQMQPKDYTIIKNDLKSLIKKLLALDMNIIGTAREKPLYSSTDFMKIEGVTWEIPKEVPHMFDVVLRLSKTSDGKFWAKTEKDRTNNLPIEFEYSYPSFVKYLGMEQLERAPVVFNQQHNLNSRSGRSFKTTFHNDEIFTAGITGDNLAILQKLSVDYGGPKLKEKLKDDYSVDSFFDLKNDEAKLLISDINKELSEVTDNKE